MIKAITCPVCEEKKFTPFLSCIDHSISKEKFTIAKCNSCELLITNPRPPIEKLDNYYISPHYTSHTKKVTSIIDTLYKLSRKFTLRWKAHLVNKHSSINTNQRILDYGCGTGEFLNVKQKQGWKIVGIEPSQVARDNANENSKQSILPSLGALNLEQSFDAITLWHVLEHVHDLDPTIKKLNTLLNENGTLFIAVPNHKSWDGNHYSEFWAGYDVPRHLWHFSKQNIERLLKKNGLTLIKIIPMRLDAFYVSILSEKYLAGNGTLISFINGIINGIRSNISGMRTKEYSSHIYIAKK